MKDRNCGLEPKRVRGLTGSLHLNDPEPPLSQLSRFYSEHLLLVLAPQPLALLFGEQKEARGCLPWQLMSRSSLGGPTAGMEIQDSKAWGVRKATRKVRLEAWYGPPLCLPVSTQAVLSSHRLQGGAQTGEGGSRML